AVVATEVRVLAGRSAEAARQIKALIDTSVRSIEAGNRLVTAAGATMEDIVDSAQQVVGIISRISAASQEQTMEIDQVNRVVIQLDAATRDNAALVVQAANAAHAL